MIAPGADQHPGGCGPPLTDALAISAGEIDTDIPPALSGLGSLMANRLRATMAQETGLQVPLRSLLGQRTLGELARDLSAGIPQEMPRAG